MCLTALILAAKLEEHDPKVTKKSYISRKTKKKFGESLCLICLCQIKDLVKLCGSEYTPLNFKLMEVIKYLLDWLS